jgi:hypothetical protein
MRTTLTSNQTSRHPPDRETDRNETQADSLQRRPDGSVTTRSITRKVEDPS